jgi:hypothetical protein
MSSLTPEVYSKIKPHKLSVNSFKLNRSGDNLNFKNRVLTMGGGILQGGPNDVFIFQITNGINQADGTRVTLTGGTQAKNIIWQACETVAIGTGSHFEGIILGGTNITVGLIHR